MALDLDGILNRVLGTPASSSRKSSGKTGDKRGLSCWDAAEEAKYPVGWEFAERLEACRSVRAMIERGDGRGHINTDRVVTVSLGLGRDSFTILGLLKEGKLIAEGHRVRPQDVDGIIFADPGAEWLHSMNAIEDAQRMADDLSIPFYWLKKPAACDYEPYLEAVTKQRKRLKGVHLRWERAEARKRGMDLQTFRAFAKQHKKQVDKPPRVKVSPEFANQWRNWQKGTESLSIAAKADVGFYHMLAPIIEDFAARNRLVQFSDKNCTVNHKIVPIRKLMEDLSIQKFNLGARAWGLEVARGKRVPHLSLVGIAYDESSADPNTPTGHQRDSKRHAYGADRHTHKWSAKEKKHKPITVGPWANTEAYPLVEMGVTKDDEQAILDRHDLGHIFKSGCFMCPFQPTEWYWLLHVRIQNNDPWAIHAIDRIAEAERRSIASGEGGPRIKDKRIQGKRKGKARLTIRQALPVIERVLIKPLIDAYRKHGLTEASARHHVVRDILRKDYAQGCKLGSVNRLFAWAHSCGCGQ